MRLNIAGYMDRLVLCVNDVRSHALTQLARRTTNVCGCGMLVESSITDFEFELQSAFVKSMLV